MVARNSSKVEERDRNSPPAPITGDARDAGSNPAWFLEGLPDAVDTTGIGSLMAERSAVDKAQGAFQDRTRETRVRLSPFALKKGEKNE